MKSTQITRKIIDLMSPEDREHFSREASLVADPTPPEESKTCQRLERGEHNIYINWLNQNNYVCYRHSRTDKPTREPTGVPDFSVYKKWELGVERTAVTPCLLIEFKVPGAKQTEIQALWASYCGGVVHVVHSALEAINLTKIHLDQSEINPIE
jgi:Uma2 family endonuclease